MKLSSPHHTRVDVKVGVAEGDAVDEGTDSAWADQEQAVLGRVWTTTTVLMPPCLKSKKRGCCRQRGA